MMLSFGLGQFLVSEKHIQTNKSRTYLFYERKPTWILFLLHFSITANSQGASSGLGAICLVAPSPWSWNLRKEVCKLFPWGQVCSSPMDFSWVEMGQRQYQLQTIGSPGSVSEVCLTYPKGKGPVWSDVVGGYKSSFCIAPHSANNGLQQRRWLFPSCSVRSSTILLQTYMKF